MSRPLITELPACGPSRGGNHPKTLRGPVGKERPAGPRSHIRERNALNRVARQAAPVVVARGRITTRPADARGNMRTGSSATAYLSAISPLFWKSRRNASAKSPTLKQGHAALAIPRAWRCHRRVLTCADSRR
jgi:hypothetical protein